MKTSPLAADILDALDGELENCELTRDALLEPYTNWTDEDRVVASVDPKTGQPTELRFPRTLGQPFALGIAPREDPLSALGSRLARAGGSAAPLARVSRATAAMGQLLISYEQGQYSRMSIKEWRTAVAKLFEKAKEAILSAKQDIEAWEKTLPAHMPSSKGLKDELLIFPEMIMQMLGGKIDAARKLLSSGAYGKPVYIGKRIAVLKDDMLEAMRAQAAEVAPTTKKPATSPLANLPRKCRGRMGRRASTSSVGSEAPPPVAAPPARPDARRVAGSPRPKPKPSE